MLAPAPPRCWTRSSTRKDSETFSSCPSTNCSTNFPGKVIRWSVAIEPVTATGTVSPWVVPLEGGPATGRCGDRSLNSLGACRAARSPGRVWSGQDAAQPPRQLQRPHQSQHRSDGCARGDDGDLPAEHGHDPGPTEGHAG